MSLLKFVPSFLPPCSFFLLFLLLLDHHWPYKKYFWPPFALFLFLFFVFSFLLSPFKGAENPLCELAKHLSGSKLDIHHGQKCKMTLVAKFASFNSIEFVTHAGFNSRRSRTIRDGWWCNNDSCWKSNEFQIHHVSNNIITIEKVNVRRKL